MNETNRNKNKQKITYTATDEGIERAERALKRDFGSKTNFAKSSSLSRSTITKFFSQKPIQFDCFQQICEELKLSDWQEIAGIKQADNLKGKEIDFPISSYFSRRSKAVQTLTRQITIIDETNNTVRAVITLQGDINSAPNKKIFETILSEHSGKTIKIIDLKSGSIKLLIEGSPEDIKQIVSLIKLKEIRELSGFPVEEIEIINKSSDATETIDPNNKWSLVKIVKQRGQDRDLSNTDLGGVNLRGVNLKDAILKDTILKDADLSLAILSGADLRNANLRNTDLSAANLKDANLRNANLRNANLRGANLSLAILKDTILKDADLSLAILSNAILNSVNLRDARLVGANLRNADLSNADLSNARLVGADLSNADLRDARLVGADLTYSQLNNANLIRVNSIGADLSNAELLKANLTDADFSGVNVKNARFGYNSGISEDLKRDLVSRGAIFEDSPGDRERILTPV